MSVYRENPPNMPTPPIKVRCEESLCTFPPCTCGCPHDEHYWFNSEFVECQGKGFTSCSMPDCDTEHALCKCERYEPSVPIEIDRRS